MSMRRFADTAGFTCHCWECKHAKDWKKRSVTDYWGTCELTGIRVGKYDSPTNPCSRIPDGSDWSES